MDKSIITTNINNSKSFTAYIKSIMNELPLVYNEEEKIFILNDHFIVNDYINIEDLSHNIVIYIDNSEHFDGNGYTIDLSSDYLIDCCNNSYKNTITNLTLKNSRLIGDNNKTFHVYNCVVLRDINNESGGIIGNNCEDYILENSIFSGIVNVSNSGGLVGKDNIDCSIKKVIFNGKLEGNNSGGIAGPRFKGSIENSYSVCNLDKENNSGLIAKDSSSSSITNCYIIYNTDEKNETSVSDGFDIDNITKTNVYSNNEASNLVTTNEFIEDIFDYNQYPLLKCFREIPWMRDSYENYNQVAELATSLRDLLNSGYTEIELKQFGYTIKDFKYEKYTVTELLELGYTLREISLGGYTTAEILSEGYTMAMILEDSQKLEDIIYNGNRIISKTISYGKTIYKFKDGVERIIWSNMTGINPVSDYIELKPNDIFDGNGVIIDMSGITTRGLFKCEGTSISNAPIIKNINIINGRLSFNDFYDQGNAFIVQKECKYFIVENCVVTSDLLGEFSGGIAGMYSGYDGGHCIIKNCNFIGNIVGNHAGGISGASSGNGKGNCIIENCESSGNILGGGSGGIVGFASGNGNGNCEIKNSVFNGNISGERSGGIVGSHAGNRGNCVVYSCEVEGNISGGWAGGIVGENAGYYGNCKVSSCNYSGNINNEYCGGIAGMNAGYQGNCEIEYCNTNNCNLFGLGNGGICGGNAGINGNCNISKCKIGNDVYRCNITGEICGGIAGAYAGKLTGSCHIEDCVVLCDIDGNNSGGIVGGYSGLDGSCNITRCIYDGAIEGENNGGIVGSYAGMSGLCNVSVCYSKGNINGIGNGGLVGAYSAMKSGRCNINDCYSVMIIGSSNGGFIGSNCSYSFGLTVIQNSYFVGSYIDSSYSNIILEESINELNGITILQNIYVPNDDISYDVDGLIKDGVYNELNNEINDSKTSNNIICEGNHYDIIDTIIRLKAYLNIPWYRDEYNDETNTPRLTITLGELEGSSYTEQEYIDAGYSATEIANIGFNIRDLLNKGLYRNNELFIGDYLKEMNNIDDIMKESYIIEDFNNYGIKFSLEPLENNELYSDAYNYFVDNFILENEDTTGILFMLTDELQLTSSMKSYLIEGNYLYINGYNNKSVKLYTEYIPELLTLKSNSIIPNILYNNSSFNDGDTLYMKGMTFMLNGYGLTENTDYVAILLKGLSLSSSSGDPHIYPLDGGIKYELPIKEANYRLLQGDNLIINGSTRNIRKEESSEIIEYFEKKTNKIAPKNLMTKGVFYDKIYIYSEGLSLIYNIESKDLKTNMRGVSGFKYNIREKSGRRDKEEENCDKIIELNIEFQHSIYGLVNLIIKYYSNPQIKYGIELKLENCKLNNISGLLVRESSCKYMELNKLTNKNKKKERKERNNVFSYHKKL